MKSFLPFAAISGMLCVVLGAFGAHGLKPLLSQDLLAVYETAVRYQFYHTLALIFVSLLYQNNQSKWLIRSGWFFISGILIFSGSLYALSLSGIGNSEPLRWLGAITPFGGVCFILGWIFMFLGVKNSGAKFKI
jgi:uncharacterized membrane protein YgdD (TMEM256/DUF423 family)